MLFSLLQDSNGATPIFVTDEGMVIEDNELQSEKARLPIVFSDDGSVIDCKLKQHSNANESIVLTFAPKVTEVRFVQK